MEAVVVDGVERHSMSADEGPAVAEVVDVVAFVGGRGTGSVEAVFAGGRKTPGGSVAAGCGLVVVDKN